jgi:hypothetical protein
MRPNFFLAGFAVSLALAGPAGAAPKPKPKPVPSIDNVYLMVDCMVAEKNAELEKSLSTLPAGPKAIEMHWFKAALGKCLVEDRPIPAANLYKRGAVAERFLYRDFQSIGASPRHPPAPVFPAVSAEELAKAPGSASSLAMLDAASCLARENPGEAYGFFRLRRDSAEERAKVMDMLPALSRCLTQGELLKLTPAMFRAFLAEAAYRVAAGHPQVFEGQS